MNTILVIEDNREVNENICEILELAGYKAHCAMNGKVGVQMAINLKPDLILCDVMMPELDGFGVLKILHSREETINIPFVFLTAKVEHYDLRKGMSLGADDYITKPFDDVQLLEAIEIRLKKRSSLSSISENSEKVLLYSETEAQKAIIKLTEGLVSIHYELDRYIWHQGQYPMSIYFLRSGLAKAVQSNRHGKTLIVDIFKLGDLFGYIPALCVSKYNYSVKTCGPCEVVVIPFDLFKSTLESNPQLSWFLHLSFARSAEVYRQRLMLMAYGSVREKVASAISYLAGHMQTENDDAIKLEHLREDLSQIAGVAKESLIRTLSDFKKEGLISLAKKEMRILDTAGFKQL